MADLYQLRAVIKAIKKAGGEKLCQIEMEEDRARDHGAPIVRREDAD